MKMIKLFLLIAVLALSAVSCRGGDQSNSDANIWATVDSTAVGETVLNVNITDGNSQPINDAKVSVKGDMTHAGMEPVLGESVEVYNGDYTIPFAWTMGGDWVVTVNVELADGSTATRDFDFSVSGEMSGEMSDEMEAEG